MPPGTVPPSPRRAAFRPARRVWQALLLGLALTGCAGLSPPRPTAGQPEAEVLARLGPPTGRYALPAGAQRLEYATGPYGRTTWMVDLGADGRVEAVQQVLTEAQFARVRPGMTPDELLRLLGRPAHKGREYMDRETWSWRYHATFCLWARVTLTAERRVQSGVAYLPDPLCDADD